MDKIIYCQVSQNREAYLRRNYEQVLPYVDQAVLVDSGSNDGTESLCKSLAPKVIYVPFKWQDNFGLSWEKSLEHVSIGDYCLICDDDELPSIEMCKQLKSIPTMFENTNYSAAEFRCHPISIEMDNKEVDLGSSNYFRLLLFRRGPDTRWEGTMHQYITGLENSDKEHVKRFVNLEYFHIKHVKDQIRASCRNWYIGGIFFSWCKDIGIIGPEHDELMDILSQCHPDVKVFNHLADHIINGTVNEKVLAWIVYYYHQYKNGCPPGGCYLCYYVPPEEREHHDYFNEIRAFYRYVYEIVHPEWKPLSFGEAKKILGKA